MSKHERKTLHDAVTRYHAERGVSDAVRQQGLRGLIDAWLRIAMSAARYDLTLDDWINDLDVRDIIAGALPLAPASGRESLADTLARADELFRSATLESKRALSSTTANDAVAADRWWYSRYPSQPGSMMRADLLGAGIVKR